jgi:hypothetical protein
LTRLGKRRLERGFACWSEAQEKFCGALGEETLGVLRGVLGAAIQAAGTVGG